MGEGGGGNGKGRRPWRGRRWEARALLSWTCLAVDLAVSRDGQRMDGWRVAGCCWLAPARLGAWRSCQIGSGTGNVPCLVDRWPNRSRTIWLMGLGSLPNFLGRKYKWA
jgi:hypothetical protein